MGPIKSDHLADQVYIAAKAAFSNLIRENSDQHFYAFALFTDDSLQFLNAAANTEEALTSTVKRYNKAVDPKYGHTSTRAGMRWAYGDWGFFAEGAEHFEEINKVLLANFESDDDEFAARIESFWTAILNGFQRLEREGFFGSGPERSQVTLLLVGDLPWERVETWVSALNPPEIADRCLNWNADAPEDASEN